MRGRIADARGDARFRRRHRAAEGLRVAGAFGEGRFHAANRQGAGQGRERRASRTEAQRQFERYVRVLASGQVHLDLSEAVPAGAAGRRRQALRVRPRPEPGHRAQAERRAWREPGRDPVRQQRPRQELHAARCWREGRHRMARDAAEGAGHAVPADRHRLSQRHACGDGVARRVRQRHAADVHEHPDEPAVEGRCVQVRRAERRGRDQRLTFVTPFSRHGPAGNGRPVLFGGAGTGRGHRARARAPGAGT
ncbi:hypothetical protein BLAT2472_10098 [Burkholderia latens]